MGKKIHEAVRALADELMQASEYEDDLSVRSAYADAAGRVRTLAKALTAAQQQGQAVAWRCAECGTHEVEVDLVCHNSACDAYANSQTVHEGWHTQPMQQGGGEVVAVTRHDAGFPPGPLFDPDAWDRLRALPKGTRLYTAPPSAPVGVEAFESRLRGRAGPFTVQPGERYVDADIALAVLREALAQQPAAVDESFVERFCGRWFQLTGRSLDRPSVRACLTEALATQHQEPTT